MENKFAIVIAEARISDRLKSDLKNLGFSNCSVFSSINNALVVEPQITPNIVIADIQEVNESDFRALKANIQKFYGSAPILFISEERIAQNLVDKGLLKKNNYINHSYTFRELDLCVDALFASNGEIKTQHIWLDQKGLISLFNVVPNGIIICDENGRILNVNRALTQILGYSTEEFSSMHIKDLTTMQNHELINQNIKRVLRGETIRSEVVNICKNGEHKNLEIIDTKILLSNGKDGLLIVSSDITHWKEINNALAESEEKYRILVEKSNDGIVFAQDGVLIYGNPRIMEMLGITSMDFIGQSFEKFIHRSEKDVVTERHQRRINGENSPEIYETLIQRVNGEPIPVEFNVNVALYRGKPTTMVFIRDISQRKLTEKFIKESEENYRSVFDSASEAIYIQDSNGVFLDVNKAALKLYDYPKSEIIGSTPDKLSAPGMNDLDAVAERFAEAFNGNTQIFEFWGLSKNRRVFPKEIILNKGKYFGADVVIAMARDITDRKNAEAILVESEANLRATLNAIPDLMFKFNREGVYLDLHAYNKEELIIDEGKLLGKSIFDLFPKEFCDSFIENINKCLEIGELLTFEYVVPLKEVLTHFEARMIPIGENEVLSFSRNITEKKKSDEKVNMLAQTIKNILECVSITDLNDRIIYVNSALNETFGYEEEELIGKDISILRSPSVSEDIAKEIYNCTKGGGWLGELMNIRKNGQEFPISLSTAVVQDDKGLPIAFVGVASDITNRKIAEQELISAKEKAEESDKLKSAFLANMSHEIRSPMNAILGFIRIIKDEEKLSENGKQYIDLVSNSGAQLVSVIEDILDTSKIQANQLRLILREFDLNALLIDLYTIYSAQVKEKHDSNTIILPPILSNPSPFYIYSDDMRIRQILTNLLSNANKFTSKGLIEFGYSIIIVDNNPLVRFYVKDTGIGLAPDALELIFERFRQADDSYTRMYGGSGLGLAISKGLIELLGGKIWVESQEGVGSTFHFTLPLKEVISNNNDNVSVNEFVKSIDGLNWSDKTFLIVEDMPEIQYFLKRVLLKTGVSLLFAASLKEAREVFKCTKNIDLILLDIRLPDGDGYNLSVEFKALKPNIPIIAQTAYAMEGGREKSISFGCDDFITKPINSDLLFLKIHSLLKKGI